MLKHELLEVLKTFSDHEKKRFGKFLNSAYFNKSPKIIRLFNILRKYHPDYNNKKITKLYIYKKLSYNKPFNDSTIRNLLYDLQIIAETYLKILNMERNMVESNVFQREEFWNRELNMLYSINLENSELVLSGRNYTDSTNIMDRFKLNSDKFYFDLAYGNLDNSNFGKNADSFRKAIVNLINYFVVEFLKHNETLFSISRDFNAKAKRQYTEDFLKVINVDKLTDYVRKNSPENGFVADTYLKLLKAFMNMNNDRFYSDLASAVAKNSRKLSIAENKYLYGRLINYCKFKIYLGKQSAKYENELFKLYDTVIKSSFFPGDFKGNMRINTYSDIFATAMKLKKLPWLEKFVASFKNKLHSDYRKEVTSYSQAIINFEKGKFKEADNNLGTIKMDGFIFEVEARGLQIMVTQHLGNVDAMHYMIDRYKDYLFHHRKMTHDERASHDNFVKFMQRLVHFQKGDERINIKTLQQNVAKAKNLLNKEWILKKAIPIAKKA
jgi:hypothetical protein